MVTLWPTLMQNNGSHSRGDINMELLPHFGFRCFFFCFFVFASFFFSNQQKNINGKVLCCQAYYNLCLPVFFPKDTRTAKLTVTCWLFEPQSLSCLRLYVIAILGKGDKIAAKFRGRCDLGLVFYLLFFFFLIFLFIKCKQKQEDSLSASVRL